MFKLEGGAESGPALMMGGGAVLGCGGVQLCDGCGSYKSGVMERCGVGVSPDEA